MAATQVPNRDSSISKVVSSRGGFHTLSAWFDPPRYIDRDEMYVYITDLRLLTRLETRNSNMMPCRSLTVTHSPRCEGAAGAAVMLHGAYVRRSSG